jgi:hypothetical protein
MRRAAEHDTFTLMFHDGGVARTRPSVLTHGNAGNPTAGLHATTWCKWLEAGLSMRTAIRRIAIDATCAESMRTVVT